MKRKQLKQIIIITTISSLVLLTANGCKSLQTITHPDNSNQLQQEVNLARQEATLCRQQLRVLNNRHQLLQQDYSKLAARFTVLENNIQQQQQVNLMLKNKLILLNKALEQEVRNRDTAIREMARNVISQTAEAVNRSRRFTSTNNATAVPKNCYRYKVQRGATLSAIAKAYKVKISDIRRVNHLKSDNIITGQILYIPQKR